MNFYHHSPPSTDPSRVVTSTKYLLTAKLVQEKSVFK